MKKERARGKKRKKKEERGKGGSNGDNMVVTQGAKGILVLIEVY